MAEPTSTRKRLDPWAEAVGEVAAESRPRAESRAASGEGSFSALTTRIRWFLGSHPLGTVMTGFGLVYAGFAVAMFGRRMFSDPAFSPPLMTYDGVALLLGWLVVPPMWFSFDFWVLSKTPAAREAAEKHHQHCRMVWLATLVVLAILSRG